MPRDDAACGLLTSFVTNIVQRMSTLPEAMTLRLETNILDLLGGVLSAHSSSNDLALVPRDELIAKIKGFAVDHLRNRRLGPAMIGEVFRISVRHVHKIFAEESLTLGRYIQSMRLEACYRYLVDPKFAHYSITDIALYWGFYDLPHMNHCFKKAYDVTPSVVRSGSPNHTAIL